MIKILVNEKSLSFPENLTLAQLQDRLKPAADVVIVNGFPAEKDRLMREGDHVVFIRRGEVPQADELAAQIAARHTPGILEKLKKSTVGIAGLGGLGSAVAIALARMGIGTLILVDYDIVEPSNLNRQHFFIDQIGLSKTEAIIEHLSRINPYVQAVTHQERITEENLFRFFGEAGVIVECFDRAEEKKMILEAAAGMLPEAFVVGASGIAGYGDSNEIKTWRLSDKIFIVGDLKHAAEPGRGLMAPRVGIAAHHQANLAVALLIDPGQAVSQIPSIP
jgi:sulfur carrier protein ThiS adenylyltransferase